MEMPHLGQHCSEQFCKKLDFLPITCDACKLIYCCDHYNYIKHNCSSAYKKDFQVPVCPLCNEPVPTSRDVSPDITVGQHIDQFCRSSKKQKIFTNGCNFKNCKKKELIPFSCSVCKINFCLKHRHFKDHDCGATKKPTKLSPSEEAAIRRQQQGNNSNARDQQAWQKIQGDYIDEDEAFAQALQLSIQEEQKNARSRNNTEVPVASASSKCSLQ